MFHCSNGNHVLEWRFLAGKIWYKWCRVPEGIKANRVPCLGLSPRSFPSGSISYPIIDLEKKNPGSFHIDILQSDSTKSKHVHTYLYIFMGYNIVCVWECIILYHILIRRVCLNTGSSKIQWFVIFQYHLSHGYFGIYLAFRHNLMYCLLYIYICIYIYISFYPHCIPRKSVSFCWVRPPIGDFVYLRHLNHHPIRFLESGSIIRFSPFFTQEIWGFP